MNCFSKVFPGDSAVKNPSGMQKMQETQSGSILGSGRSPGVGNGNPFKYSFLENPRGQRSLADYSALGCKEFDMTEVTQHTCTNCFINKHSRIMPYKHSIFDSFPINSQSYLVDNPSFSN